MSDHPLWSPPPPELYLAEGEIHLWRALLTPSPEQVQRLHALLAPDECARAARFHFERDRQRFTVTRGLLRTILGGYLGQEPALLRFEQGAHGKPALAGLPGTILRFNVSHSRSLALVALALRREVGVDVEAMRDIDLHLARHCFSPPEIEALEALPPDARRDAFFACWTRKEAYLKGIGLGLTLPLDSFSVSLGEPATLLHPPGSTWSLHHLIPYPGYVGAVAVEGSVSRIRCWDWREPDEWDGAGRPSSPRPPSPNLREGGGGFGVLQGVGDSPRPGGGYWTRGVRAVRKCLRRPPPPRRWRGGETARPAGGGLGGGGATSSSGRTARPAPAPAASAPPSHPAGSPPPVPSRSP